MTKERTLSILNLVSFLIMLAVNGLATFGLLGSTTREISDKNPSLLMPAGITFSIVWTIIYILLLIFTVYQLVSKDNPMVKDISIYFLMTNVLNVLWIFAYHFDLKLISNIIIIGLLITLLIINNKTTNAGFFIKIPFSIYFGWISVASAVSVFAYISSFDPKNFDSITMRILAAGFVVALMVITFIKSKDYAYVYTVAFAMAGILFKHIFDFNGKYPEIIIVVLIALIITLVVSIVSFIGRDGMLYGDDYLLEGGDV